MKKILTLTAGLMIMASVAMASGLYLTPGDCSASGNSQTLSNPCTSNIGTAFTLVASVVLPQPVPRFVSAGTVVDMQSATATLPDWWRVDGAGCRPAAPSAQMDNTIAPSCLTLWDSGTSVGVFQAQVGTMTTPPLAPNRLRLNAVGALIAETDLTDLVDEQASCKFAITRSLSTGAGACAGCNVGVSFALNEINFLTNGSAGGSINAPGDLVVTNPATLTSAGVNYQPGGPGYQATPTNNRTWGSIKALYR